MDRLCGASKPTLLFIVVAIFLKRISDEVIQLIFYELSDPSPLTFVSQRFYRFSQDPYVRAHYFLIHYGPTEAMYYALGRGKIITERVLDVCHISLFQCHELTRRKDSLNERRPSLSLPRPNCDTSLLPHSSTFYQISLGPECTSPCLCLFSQTRRGSVW